MNKNSLMSTLIEDYHSAYTKRQGLMRKLDDLEKGTELLELRALNFDVSREAAKYQNYISKIDPADGRYSKHLVTFEQANFTPAQDKAYSRYLRLCVKYRSITRKYSNLRASIKVMSEKLGIRVDWGNGHYASDRIYNVLSDGRLYSRAEFIKETTFATAIFGE